MIQSNDTVFLFARNIQNPVSFFQGYCFVGQDYINGYEGAEIYIKENNKSIPGGEDGCYISVSSKNGFFSFKNDYHGYKKIFYYWDKDDWVVSNSLYQIAQYLKKNNRKPMPNYSQLHAMAAKGMMMQQLSTFDTLIQGVNFLPSKHELIISNDLPPEIKRNNQLSADKSYEEALSDFINIWVSRLETLMVNNHIFISSDLTGGVDSRVILAMLLHAKKRLKDECINFPRLSCGSIAGDLKDLEVAHKICDIYNLQLNGPRSKKNIRFSGKESYKSWRDLCLGIYHPIYLPKQAPNPLIVSLGGGGGGNHRHIYDRKGVYNSIDDFVDGISEDMFSSYTWLKHEFNYSLKNTLKFLEKQQFSNSVPYDKDLKNTLIEHYRNFRNKLHAGRSPQYAVTFSPLGSLYLDIASNKLSSEHKKMAQVNYDIIYSLDPDLLKIPFDKENKNPNAKIKNSLIAVEVEPRPSQGKAYVSKEPLTVENKIGKNDIDKFEVLKESVEKACAKKFVKDFWGADFLKHAKKIANTAAADKAFRHAIDGQTISCVLASAMFFD